MVCRNCRTPNPDYVQYCSRCGSPLYHYSRPNGYRYGTYRGYRSGSSEPAEGLAIVSLIVGILGIMLCFSIIPSLLALVFGLAARSQGNKSGVATAGIVCGAAGLIIGFMFIMFWFANPYYSVFRFFSWLPRRYFW